MEILNSDPSLVHPSAGMAASAGSPGWGRWGWEQVCSAVQQPWSLWHPSQCALAQTGSKFPGLPDEAAAALGSDLMSGQRKAGGRRRRRATGKSGLFIHTRGAPISAGQSVFFHRREMNSND